MSCAGRVYKGEGLDVVIPFPYGDVDSVTVILYTSGEYSIEKIAPAIDGEVSVSLTKEEVDLLPDGVLRYTMEWDGNSVTSNTMDYIKTPVGYSAVTIEEVYESGYTAGLNACSGDCSEAIAEAYASGYTAGQEDCPECSGSTSGTCNLQSKYVTIDDTNYMGAYTVIPDEGYDGLESVDINASDWTDYIFGSGWTKGYNTAWQQAESTCCVDNYVMYGTIVFSADTQITSENMVEFAYYYGNGENWGFWEAIDGHALLEYGFYTAGTYT